MKLSKNMIQKLINLRLFANLSGDGLPIAKALIKRNLAKPLPPEFCFDPEREIQLTELGVQVAEKLCKEKNIVLEKTYEETLELSKQKHIQSLPFFRMIGAI